MYLVSVYPPNRRKVFRSLWFLIFSISQDVVIVCFALNNKDSFENAASIWCPEAKLCSPTTPIIVVGTKRDLPRAITYERAYSMAFERTGYQHYLEITANDKGIPYTLFFPMILT